MCFPRPNYLLLVIAQGDSIMSRFDRLLNIDRKLERDGAESLENMRLLTVRPSNFPANETGLGCGPSFLPTSISLAPCHRALVRAHHLMRRPGLPNRPSIHPCHPLAQPPDLIQLVAYKHHGSPRSRHFPHLP